MQAPNVSTPTRGDIGTIFVAIELSQKNWLITMHSPDRDRISQHTVRPGDQVGLLDLIERVRERARRALGTPPRVVSCYEAGYDGFWLHRCLLAAGIENHVFDPASIAVDQRARRAKSDRIDGKQLLRTLMAYLRGEPRVVQIVRVPSVEQEDARRATRERARLIGEQTAHTNRLKALLRLHGLAVGNPRRRDWLDWVAEQRDWEGQAVPSHLMAELAREHARLLLIGAQLKALEREPEGEPTPAAAEMQHRADHLARLKALGPVFSATLTNEVFYKDFRNRREVAAYFGLAPAPWKSGGIDLDQGISKAGNGRARRTSIELSWLWLLHQPNSALTQWFLQRTAGASRRIRRIAIVALARKLMVALWRYLTTGLVPEGAVLKPVTA